MGAQAGRIVRGLTVEVFSMLVLGAMAGLALGIPRPTATGVVAGCGLLAVVACARIASGLAMARQAAPLLAYGTANGCVCTRVHRTGSASAAPRRSRGAYGYTLAGVGTNGQILLALQREAAY